MWGYTPRQVDAFLFLSQRRTKRVAALDLSIATSAARGDAREVKKQIANWQKAEPDPT